MTKDINIKGFEWFLRPAFKDSVAQCKFEQGDVIYRDEPKGKTWGETSENIDFLIQVKSPTRSNTSANTEYDVFGSNWNSPIKFEKFHPNSPEKNQVIETTQGRFFSYLWKNNKSCLENETVIYPPITSNRLRPTKPKSKASEGSTVGWINMSFIASSVPVGYSCLAIIVDEVSTLITSKSQAIRTALENSFEITTELVSCSKAISLSKNLKEQEREFSPTVSVQLFFIRELDLNKINQVLEPVLFKGAIKFRITAHGILIQNNGSLF
ncbi:MAG: hypothetical protein ACI97X_000417 [Oceanospirillaceae bacterium]|jgi:hypothetical protein